MYGNRESPVLDTDPSDLQVDPVTEPDPETLSESKQLRLRAATNQVRRAVDALVPDVATVQSQVTETQTGVGGVVVIQTPGLPPIGTEVTPETATLSEEGPVLTDSEVREKATDIVAQATVVARQRGPDLSEVPAN